MEIRIDTNRRGDLKQFEEAHQTVPDEAPLLKWLGDIA
jgi:hypothetical protein